MHPGEEEEGGDAFFDHYNFVIRSEARWEM
jgi:hypothetical protein